MSKIVFLVKCSQILAVSVSPEIVQQKNSFVEKIFETKIIISTSRYFQILELQVSLSFLQKVL